jgi:maltooligosyltrehalose trehalohydrolase
VSPVNVHEMPFGAAVRPGGRVRFRLWAPAQRVVRLALDGAPSRPMQPHDGGWHELELPARAGARYRYVLEDGHGVPDPASRHQPDDVHGPSAVVDPMAYRWRHDGWRGRPWHETVLYELHAGLCGGFAGVQRLLPHLADLGVTAVELMPVADFSGMRNWGYDGVLAYAPDAAYGRPDELKALVDAAHGHGLMVFLDVVYNHFGPDGNYLHAYAPPFFRADRHTPWGAAIDFGRREVRDYFVHNALYWLREYRVDGLRFDAVHAIAERDFLEELAATVRRTLDAEQPDRHVHLVLENEHNDAALLGGPPAGRFDAQWNDDFHNAMHVLLTGEREGYYGAYHAGAAGHLARCLGEGFAWQGEAMPDGHRRGAPSAHLPPTAFVGFLQNHDQVGNRAQGERLVRLADPAALRAATALLLLAPHVPLLFMGEDWGSEAPFLFFTDFRGALADAVREGRRREFARFAAYADPGARASIPDPNAPETFERSRVLPPRETPVLSEHRALLRLRRERLTPRLPRARALGARVLGSHAVRAQWRLGDGSLWTLACNLGAEPVPCPAAAGELLHATRPALPDALAMGELPPRCAGAWLEPP